MDITALLKDRHRIHLQWVEPWPGTSKDGNRVDCHITLRASVHDCINYHRKPGQPKMTDADVLQDFISVNHVGVVDTTLGKT